MIEHKNTMIQRYCQYVRDGLNSFEIYKQEKQRLSDDIQMKREQAQQTAELLTELHDKTQETAEKAISELLEAIKL